MKQNVFLPIIGILVVLLLITSVVYLGLTYRHSVSNENNSTTTVGFPSSTSTKPLSLSTNEIIIQGANSSSMPLSNPQLEIPVGWQTYRLDEYKFQIYYPASWLLTNKVWEPFLAFGGNNAYQALNVTNLYSERVEKGDQEAVGVTVAVYDKPFSTSLSQWLFTVIPNLSKAEKGDINRALTKAYSGETGILTYNELKEGDVTISEVGAVAINGLLSYVTYINESRSRYAYAVELHLPFGKKWKAPPDSSYVMLFNQIISTIKFID